MGFHHYRNPLTALQARVGQVRPDSTLPVNGNTKGTNMMRVLPYLGLSLAHAACVVFAVIGRASDPLVGDTTFIMSQGAGALCFAAVALFRKG